MENKTNQPKSQNENTNLNSDAISTDSSPNEKVEVTTVQVAASENSEKSKGRKVGSFFRITLDVAIAYFISGLITSVIFRYFIPESAGFGAIFLFWPLIIVTFFATIYGLRKLAKYLKSETRAGSLVLTFFLLFLLLVFVIMSIVSVVNQFSRLSTVEYPKLPFTVYSPTSPRYKQGLLFMSHPDTQKYQYVQTVLETSYRDDAGTGKVYHFNVHEFPITNRFNPPANCDSHKALEESEVPCELVDNTLRPLYYANRGGYDVVYALFDRTVVTVSAEGWGKDKEQIERMITLLNDMTPNKKYSN